MNKIGVLTLSGEYNYGNRLQNYAVIKLLSEFDFTAETLIVEDEKYPLLFRVKHKLTGVKLHEGSVENGERKLRFQTFDSLIPKRTIKKKDLKTLRKQYDYFVVGSDQVWQPGVMIEHKSFSLKFADARQKIALSPSVGISHIEKKYKFLYKNMLRDFPHISIREKAGASELGRICGRTIPVMPDPTLCIDASEWRKVACNDYVPSNPYVFTYVLGELSLEKKRFIKQICEEKNAALVELTDHNGLGELPAGPSEFLALIDSAEYVVTDSYHGVIFSILFGTPVSVLERVSNGSDMFSRLETLLDTFSLMDAVCGEGTWRINDNEMYKVVSGRLEVERMRMKEYLVSCLCADTSVEVELACDDV